MLKKSPSRGYFLAPKNLVSDRRPPRPQLPRALRKLAWYHTGIHGQRLKTVCHQPGGPNRRRMLGRRGSQNSRLKTDVAPRRFMWLTAARSQSISPVACFSAITASAFFIARSAAVFAFCVSTRPSSQVEASVAIGPKTGSFRVLLFSRHVDGLLVNRHPVFPVQRWW